MPRMGSHTGSSALGDVWRSHILNTGKRRAWEGLTYQRVQSPGQPPPH